MSTAVVAEVTEANLPGRDYRLSVDQALAVEKIATSGRVLDVLVGPAGTGKSTAMAGLRAVWEQVHGQGSVIGLAPSAVAAQVLADELGIETENTAKWLTEWQAHPRADRTSGPARSRTSPGTPTHVLRARPGSAPSSQRRTRPSHERRLKPGQLVMIDESLTGGDLQPRRARECRQDSRLQGAACWETHAQMSLGRSRRGVLAPRQRPR